MAEKQRNREYERKWKELTLSDNFIFQKFMLTPENCKKVLSEILGVEVVNVEYPKYEKFIDIRRDSKAIRLDVYVKGDDAVYNVEMQCSSNEHIPKRSRFYQDFKDFINAVNGQFDNNEYSVTIKSEVEKIKNSDRWRTEYMNLYWHDQEIMRKSKDEGREEGRIEEKKLAIKNMFKKLPPDEIIELGYDRELVISIAEEG